MAATGERGEGMWVQDEKELSHVGLKGHFLTFSQIIKMVL